MPSSPGGYRFIDSSIDLNSSKISLELSGRYKSVYSALGFHPFSVKSFSASIVSDYAVLIDKSEKVAAIGEIGLDHKAGVSFQEQEEVLSLFIGLARDKNLPVMIHNRWPDTRILAILDKFYSKYEKVVFHCFSYGPDFLAKIVEKGGFVSFSLNILRKKEEIIRSLEVCPLERIILETDSPYMRINGKPSTPLDIDKVYQAAAKIKGISREELVNAVRLNIKELFPGVVN